MNSRLAQILLAIKSPTIMVIGDLILDKYSWGEVKRISPEAPIPIINIDREEVRPGGAGFVINNLLRLGAKVLASGVVGADAEGQKLLQMLKNLGAETSGVFKDPERPTTVKVRMMGHLQTAGRGIQQLLRVDYEKTHPLPVELEDEILRYVKNNLPDTDLIAISDMNKGLLSRRLTQAISDLAVAQNKSIIVDPRLGNDPSLYRGVTAITPNRYETEVMTGIKPSDLDSLRLAGSKLVKDLCLQCAIITLDKDGVFLYKRDGSHHLLHTHPREVSDVTGAGDMVLSVVSLVVGSGFDFLEAAHLANVAAGIEVSKIGAVPVSRQEILQELSGGPPSLQKIKTEEDLKDILNKHRCNGEKVVFTNGCFDILHVGHVEYLRFARSQGDVLIVGINTDRSVREIKGPNRPILAQEDRARLLAALEDVDYVVPFDEPTPERVIKRLKPDVLVKGEDWREKGVVGGEFVESYGGRVVLAPLVQGVSTTDIISRILRENQKVARPRP